MIDEFKARVLLENSIRERVRAIKNGTGDDQIRSWGAVKALQKVLEYDDFTIDCIKLGIEKQEGVR